MANVTVGGVQPGRRLTIAGVLETKLSVGGGFNQALSALQQMASLAAAEGHRFTIHTTVPGNIDILASLGLPARVLARDRAPSFTEQLRQTGRSKKARYEAPTAFEQAMRTDGVDLVYFPAPTFRARQLQTTAFIFTIWDLLHLEHPEFPEVRERREFEKREEMYGAACGAAYRIIVDGPHVAELTKRHYGLVADKIIQMPFSPSPFLNSERPSEAEVDAVLLKHKLKRGYFFYPAQFWAHKNHARLLEAAALLKPEGHEVRFAFAGGDAGMRDHVEALVADLGLADQARFLGFVPSEDMAALFLGSAGLVMPSYCGPANLPPMEAWGYGLPVLYPEAFRSFSGDAAVHCDWDDERSVADALLTLLEPGGGRDWSVVGAEKMREIAQMRTAAEAQLAACLREFAARRRCWAV